MRPDNENLKAIIVTAMLASARASARKQLIWNFVRLEFPIFNFYQIALRPVW